MTSLLWFYINGRRQNSSMHVSYYFHIMAKKEKGSPAENKGDKDVKFKGKSKEAEHEI